MPTLGGGEFRRILAQPVEERLHCQHDRPSAFTADRRYQEPGLFPAKLGDDFLRALAGFVLGGSWQRIGTAGINDRPVFANRPVRRRTTVDYVQLGPDGYEGYALLGGA